MSGLRWTFDDCGGWNANSAINCAYWRINVCDDGTFGIAESDNDLTNRDDTFDTLLKAKLWCETQENIFTSRKQDTGLQSLSDFLGEQIEKLNSLRRCNVYMNDLNDGLEEHVESSGDFVRYADLDAIVAEMKTRAEKEKS